MSAFDEIIKRSPIDKTARDVTSSGCHFSFEPRQLNSVRSENPLPITTRMLPHEENFTGTVLGRLTVIGRSDDPLWKPGKPVKWVVRCACGFYERRRSRALRKLSPDEQMCSHCKLLEQRKAGFGPWTNRDKQS